LLYHSLLEQEKGEIQDFQIWSFFYKKITHCHSNNMLIVEAEESQMHLFILLKDIAETRKCC